MRSSRFVAVLLVLTLLTAAGSAWAVGPLDGSYQTKVLTEDFEFTLYIVVLQKNNNEFGTAVLDPDFGFWSYGFGTLNADNRVTGPLIDPTDPNGGAFGQFDFQFQGHTVTGSITYFTDTPAPLSGTRFF